MFEYFELSLLISYFPLELSTWRLIVHPRGLRLWASDERLQPEDAKPPPIGEGVSKRSSKKQTNLSRIATFDTTTCS